MQFDKDEAWKIEKLSGKSCLTHLAWTMYVTQKLYDLCDYMRKIIRDNHEFASEDNNVINFIASTDISVSLIRKNKRMVDCMSAPIRRRGVKKLSLTFSQY